jgi:hypothetical protein
MQKILKVLLLLVLAFAQAQWVQRASMPTKRSDISATTVGDYISMMFHAQI